MPGHALAAGGVATWTQQATFWLLAVVSVSAALGLVLLRRAVYCALMLAVVMLSLAVLYALQGAPFLAFVQVIVYTGAVLMLFLFVLMIVGIRARDSLVETLWGQRLWAGLAAIGLLVLLGLTIGHAVLGAASPAASGPSFGATNLNGIARLIFTTYVFPFEVTSALLITAALGAMVLAHRERTSPKPTQRDLSRIRVASGDPAPLPGPGTYARHNGADMPALLPDGTPAATSVSPYISQRIEPPSVTAGPPGGQISPPVQDSPGPDGEPPALAGREAAGRPARPAQEGDPS